MKIGIFTGRVLEPLHPRIVSYLEYFDNKGLTCEIVPPVKNSILSRINWLSLHFFDTYSILINRKRLRLYDLIIIQDLKYLPLARFAKKYNKVVIYETLDNNVSLRGYQLLRKLPFLKLFEKSIIRSFTKKEKNLAFNYCDSIIVNSKALVKYFDNQARLIYYCSSFEKVGLTNNPGLTPALLYLGEFSSEKGAEDVLDLQKRLGIELYIFGTIRKKSLSEAILMNSMIHHENRLSHKDLESKFKDLFKQYFFIGTSFIKSIHFSYATQEANKEIDYLAMGVPIVGNHRQPTEEKIIAGCGVFSENEAEIEKLISGKDYREKLSLACVNYYRENYSDTIFNLAIDKVFAQYKDPKNA